MKAWLRYAAACCVLFSTVAQGAELAVVIDDIGYSTQRGSRAIALPGPVTIAVLPFAPHTQTLIQQAIAAGKDVIIHQPMEPTPSARALEETGTLKLSMPEGQFAQTLSAALAAVPQGIGLSNHTGSLLTAHRAPMQQVMQQLSHRGLFFIDSRTTADTVALRTAREAGVPAIRRDVFLDHDPDPIAIANAFSRSLQIARRKGHALLVGHPYHDSLTFLADRLAALPDDITLVSAARLAQLSQSKADQIPPDRPPDPASPRISLGL